MPELVNDNNRLDALLALRGFACLMVVIIHCAPPRNTIIYQGYDLSWILFSHGSVAVWIFFCLSGYLMGKAFYTKRYTADVSGVIDFWRNRALRIFPLYYFAILILTVFVHPELFKIINWGYLVRICTFTYHPYIISPYLDFDGAFWSLSTEVQFYIIVPFIYTYLSPRLFNKQQVSFAAIFVILFTLLLKSISWFSLRHEIVEQMAYAFKYWYSPLITSLDVFLCGFLLNVYFTEKPNLKKSATVIKYDKSAIKYIAVILMLLLYTFTAYHLYHQELWGLPNRSGGFRTSTTIFILQPLTALLTAFFIFAFESDTYYLHIKSEKLSLASILKNPLRILEVFGNLSYGIYIWHMPIIGKIMPIYTSDIPIEAFYSRLTATLFLSILLAIVTYYLVELPASKWKILPR